MIKLMRGDGLGPTKSQVVIYIAFKTTRIINRTFRRNFKFSAISRMSLGDGSGVGGGLTLLQLARPVL